MRRARLLILVSLAAILTLLVTGCTVGPETGPAAVRGDGGAGPAEPGSEQSAPTLSVPQNDLAWTDCRDELLETYPTRVPDGVDLQCGVYESQIDPQLSGTSSLRVSAVRATTGDTPADAAPLVLTSGSDLPSSQALLLLARGAGRSLLDRHPVVAVDRRGIGESSPLDCMTRDERVDYLRNGLPLRGDVGQPERINRLAQNARSASDGCSEIISPYQLSYGNTGAAADLERLREIWQVDHLGLIGLGQGAEVAIAYTGLFPDRLGRLILDTPTPYGVPARDTVELRATGVQEALDAFTTACAAGECPLGGDPRARLRSMMNRAAAGDLGELSDAQLLSAITTSLALDAAPPARARLAEALAAADRGDDEALTELAERAATLRTSDGALVARCNDVIAPIGLNEIPGLIAAWSNPNPLTGTTAALDLVRCTGWATVPPPPAPEDFAVDVLVVNGSHDPINGGNGAARLSPVFIGGDTDSTTVTWQGQGYSVLAHSGCAVDITTGYIAESPLTGPTDRTCPD